MRQWSLYWGIRYLSPFMHCLLTFSRRVLGCVLPSPKPATVAALWSQQGLGRGSGRVEIVHTSIKFQGRMQEKWEALHSPCKYPCTWESTLNSKLKSKSRHGMQMKGKSFYPAVWKEFHILYCTRFHKWCNQPCVPYLLILQLLPCPLLRFQPY